MRIEYADFPLTSVPTNKPSFTRTIRPTSTLTMKLSVRPTYPPSVQPTGPPATRPNATPKAKPSPHPTVMPTENPSMSPTMIPSTGPSSYPSIRPTVWPESSWITHVSPLYGNINSNLTVEHRSCPKGYKVVSIKGTFTEYINQLEAWCDDTNKIRLGAWRINRGQDITSSCSDDGFSGWNVTHGSYIYRMSFFCTSSPTFFGTPYGFDPRETDKGSPNVTSLSQNQSIVVFQVYYNTSRIYAMRIEYADFNSSDQCHKPTGEPTGKCPTESDWLALAWGFLTVVGVVSIVGSIIGYIHRKRHKKMFKELDGILPLT